MGESSRLKILTAATGRKAPKELKQLAPTIPAWQERGRSAAPLSFSSVDVQPSPDVGSSLDGTADGVGIEQGVPDQGSRRLTNKNSIKLKIFDRQGTEPSTPSLPPHPGIGSTLLESAGAGFQEELASQLEVPRQRGITKLKKKERSALRHLPPGDLSSRKKPVFKLIQLDDEDKVLGPKREHDPSKLKEFEDMERRGDPSKLIDISDCARPNNSPIGKCTDWITGPASVNKDLKMNLGNWPGATLHMTDQGWLVMSPNGDDLVLVAYGDTSVVNPGFKAGDLQNFISQHCIGKNSFCSEQFNKKNYNENKRQACKDIFKILGGATAKACEYVHESMCVPDPNSTTVPKECLKHRGIPEFDFYHNVVFFEAEIDTSRPFHIKFGDHLHHKTVLKNSMEGNPPYFVGTYTGDYFYVCPKNLTTCGDYLKILYFTTGTIYWHKDTPQREDLSAEQKKFDLTRSGAGFYRFGPFGPLSEKTKDTSTGCRLRFAPSTVQNLPTDCPPPKTVLQPKHPQRYGPGSAEQVVRTANANVLWGLGSKFSPAIVAHGFVDPYHRPGPYQSADYIYFIGSGEFESYNKEKDFPIRHTVAAYKPTGHIYLARVLASEWALQNAQFEYFTGRDIATHCSEWGIYDDASPIITLPGVIPSSFTKRFGKYYMAALCGLEFPVNILGTEVKWASQGMCVLQSEDGFVWKQEDYDYAEYSSTPTSFIPGMVYGHAWVPKAVYPSNDYIPYVFSLWKSIYGYFDDFWFTSPVTLITKKHPIKTDHRFLDYNTKMYQYLPKSKRPTTG